MDWFQNLTGYSEAVVEWTRSQLVVERGRLRSLANGREWAIGKLDLVSLAQLRQQVATTVDPAGRPRVRIVRGDVRAMHRQPEHAGALFQVASQFNLLEMVSPNVTPEDGVTRYERDCTQGPACAIAAGAATIYRNYFVPVDGVPGQTATRQLDGLRDIGRALADATGLTREQLWTMRNGYALAEREGLDAINRHLRSLDDVGLDELRGLLRIGVHEDVEVTDEDRFDGTLQLVSQAFCSALPVAYSRVPAAHWAPFAQLVLEAAYEATLLAAVLNARRGASRIVLLTRLGGGAFGNDDRWIDAAMKRALDRVSAVDLDVLLVTYGEPVRGMVELEKAFAV